MKKVLPYLPVALAQIPQVAGHFNQFSSAFHKMFLARRFIFLEKPEAQQNPCPE